MLSTLPWPSAKKYSTIRPGLEATTAFLAAAGNPHRSMSPIIHIAGTNGKGSTTATIKSLLSVAGYSCHVYTSPHLVHWNERFSIAGSCITDEYYLELSKRCQDIEFASGIELSHFEGLTCLAFLAFAENQADACIVEVGIGGRLDATNVIEQPALSVITSISMDHTEFLGDSLPKIAFEKAGIMKSGSTCVAASQVDEVAEVIIDHAEKIGVPLLLGGRDWSYSATRDGFALTMESYKGSSFEQFYPPPHLAGDHQLENTALALTCMLVLSEKYQSSHTQRCKGITQTRWPGRLQRVCRESLPQAFSAIGELWLDGAHNQAGAQSLGRWLRQQKELPLILVVGCSRGRSFVTFMKQLNPHSVSQLIIVQSTTDGTVLSEEDEDPRWIETITGNVSRIRDVTKLSDNLLEPQGGGARVLVCGSLHLVGDFLRVFDIKF